MKTWEKKNIVHSKIIGEDGKSEGINVKAFSR
jgi:hypothetical protein